MHSSTTRRDPGGGRRNRRSSPWPGMPDDPFGGHGHRRWRPGPQRGRGRRSRRGDVRTAILALLAERPMHGYEMIQEITERSGELWRPSPGSVYPTLQLLADEGLVQAAEGNGGKRRYELTDEGRAAVERLGEGRPWDQVSQDIEPGFLAVREATAHLMGAMYQVAHAGSPAQRARATEVINKARRDLYAILGDDDADERSEED